MKKISDPDDGRRGIHGIIDQNDALQKELAVLRQKMADLKNEVECFEETKEENVQLKKRIRVLESMLS